MIRTDRQEIVKNGFAFIIVLNLYTNNCVANAFTEKISFSPSKKFSFLSFEIEKTVITFGSRKALERF